MSMLGKYCNFTMITVVYTICVSHHDLSKSITKIDVKQQPITVSYTMV
jgi:hypothetical protein